MILPLFPSLLDHYHKHDGPDGVYQRLLHVVKYFQKFVGAPDEFNGVLFGGMLIVLICITHTEDTFLLIFILLILQVSLAQCSLTCNLWHLLLLEAYQMCMDAKLYS